MAKGKGKSRGLIILALVAGAVGLAAWASRKKSGDGISMTGSFTTRYGGGVGAITASAGSPIFQDQATIAFSGTITNSGNIARNVILEVQVRSGGVFQRSGKTAIVINPGLTVPVTGSVIVYKNDPSGDVFSTAIMHNASGVSPDDPWGPQIGAQVDSLKLGTVGQYESLVLTGTYSLGA